MAAPGKNCGECTLCCKLLAVKEFKKPIGIMCEHCSPDHGCTIYEDRPQRCRNFECLWLKSDLPGSLKPSNCGVIFRFSIDKKNVIGLIDPDKQHAFTSPSINEFGERLDTRGTGLFGTIATNADTDSVSAGNDTAARLLAEGMMISGINKS